MWARKENAVKEERQERSEYTGSERHRTAEALEGGSQTLPPFLPTWRCVFVILYIVHEEMRIPSGEEELTNRQSKIY